MLGPPCCRQKYIQERGWEDSRKSDMPVPFSLITCSFFKTSSLDAISLALLLSFLFYFFFFKEPLDNFVLFFMIHFLFSSLPTFCWSNSPCGNCFRKLNWNFLVLCQLNSDVCFWVGQEKFKCILEHSAVLRCRTAVSDWIRHLEELTFLLLGHHSIYSKPWQWYMTQAVCKPYDLRIYFLTTRSRTVFLKYNC